MKVHKPHPEAGNAFFIILVAIVLFAALSYTVAQMMRGGNPETLSEQKSALFADEIIDYARTLRQGTQAARINGCAELDISFDSAVVSGYAHTPSVSETCRIFSTAGQGTPYLAPADNWLDPNQSGQTFYGQLYFPANVCIPGIGTSGSGTGCNSDAADNEDLIVIVPYLKRGICEQINDKLGVGGIPSETSNAWLPAGTKFTGSQSDGERLDQAGRMNGCFEGSGASTPPSGTYHFFQVLVPR